MNADVCDTLHRLKRAYADDKARERHENRDRKETDLDDRLADGFGMLKDHDWGDLASEDVREIF